MAYFKLMSRSRTSWYGRESAEDEESASSEGQKQGELGPGEGSRSIPFPAASRRGVFYESARPETKNPPCFRMPGFQFWRRPTLAQPVVALPSGLQRFTSVFGMGTGGSTALRSPEISADRVGADLWLHCRLSIANGRFRKPAS